MPDPVLRNKAEDERLAALVLRALVRNGPLDIAHLSAMTSATKRHVRAAVDGLENDSLIRQATSHTGRLGLFEFRTDGRLVAGVDLSDSMMAVGIGDLSGAVHARLSEPLMATTGDSVVEAIRGALSSLLAGRSQPVTAVVASPGIVDDGGLIDLAATTPVDGWALAHDLREALGVRVIVENDVNVAAVAERLEGVARGVDDLAVLTVGRGVGLGVIVNGQLVRGRHRATGEVAWLPFGPDATSRASKRRGSVELVAAASGLREALATALERSTSAALTVDSTVAEVLDAALAGDRIAARLVDVEAEFVAKIVLSVALVIDPELVVLRGGIAGHAAMLGPVREGVARMAPFPIQIETSTLGAGAGVVGAVMMAADQARAHLVGSSDAREGRSE